MNRRDKENCLACRYFCPISYAEDGSGECRAHPPALVPTRDGAGWPVTLSYEWCGEYRSAAEEPETMSVPEAGRHFFGLSANGSYLAAARGDIPSVKIGRLRRVPVALLRKSLEAGK